jgi:lysyl-tRNA synthetase class 2
MKRIAVDSSGIQTIGYDQVKKILEVEFINDHVYRYRDVPEMLYVRLMKAPSKGAFFNKKIRDAGYPFEQIK